MVSTKEEEYFLIRDDISDKLGINFMTVQSLFQNVVSSYDEGFQY